MEIPINTAFRVPVLVVDSTTGAGVTGVLFGAVSCHLQKQAGASTLRTVLNTQWFEIDATNMPGVYDLLLTASDTDTAGVLKYAVQVAGSDLYLGTADITSIDSTAVLDFIRRFLTGRWKLDTATNKFIVYDEGGVMVLKEYTTKNAAGTPATTAVAERVPLP